MEQGSINQIGGRIFGNDSNRKKEEFDRMIIKQLELTFNKYLRHQSDGMWLMDDFN